MSPSPEAGSERWNAALAEQDRALPPGDVVVSCPARLGAGGLGRHMQEMLDALARRGQHASRMSEEDVPQGRIASRLVEAAGRVSPSWRMLLASRSFDRRAARRLPRCDSLIAFNGTALAQFEAAARAGASLHLMSANSHYRQLVARHELAYSQYPVEAPWAPRLLERNLREYDRAERILVTSEYMRESFISHGVAAERLARFPLTPDPRFAPTPGPAGDGPEARAAGEEGFELLYVGSLLVHKGVPLLLDAFSRLDMPDLSLRLLGGWTTGAMRRLIEQAIARDPRISAGPGDPLPHLRRARLCVHPSYEDGFAYAPAEALAAGVPVLVSEDTGMKELIDRGRTGVVVPTGDRDALTEAISAFYRGEALRGEPRNAGVKLPTEP
jgi:glycosyltransferase involved in cell wall biosynthesis